MKKKMVVCLLGLLLVISLILPTLTIAQGTKPGVIKWRGQTSFSSTVTPYGPFRPGETGIWAATKHWYDWLKYRTNGRLVIEWREPGAIFPITETDNAVSQGVVDIASTYCAYFSGRMQVCDVEGGGLFFWDTIPELYECLHKYGLFNAIQKAYAKRNIHWLPQEFNAIVGIGTTFPAPSSESIKGRKIRTAGLWGDYIAALGGAPVAIPWGDVYMAAKLGTVDGWCGGVASLEELKLKEVAKGYVVFPNITLSPGSFLINKRSYEALPKDLQEILQKESPHWSFVTSSYWYNQCIWAIQNAQKEYGIKIYSWSSDDVAKVRQLVADTVWPKISGKSPENAELMDIVKKQLKDYGKIK